MWSLDRLEVIALTSSVIAAARLSLGEREGVGRPSFAFPTDLADDQRHWSGIQ